MGAVSSTHAAQPIATHMHKTQPTDHRDAPPWMGVAFTQHGVRERPGPATHPNIAAYHATTKLHATSDEVAWCSAFINWCMLQSGLQGTNSAKARDWLDWGVPLQLPRLGCVTILQSPLRGPEAGHVGLWWMDRSSSEAWLYGGNQDNAVGLKSYPRVDILGYRWPADQNVP